MAVVRPVPVRSRDPKQKVEDAKPYYWRWSTISGSYERLAPDGKWEPANGKENADLRGAADDLYNRHNGKGQGTTL